MYILEYISMYCLVYTIYVYKYLVAKWYAY